MIAGWLTACGGEDSTPNSSNTTPQATNVTETVTEPATTDSSNLAARVNGIPISQADFEAELAISTINLAGAASSDALRETVLATLVDEVLIEHYAAANGIIIEDEMLQAELESLQTLAAQSGYTLAEVMGLPTTTDITIIEQTVYETLLTQAVADDIVAKAGLVAVQVRARHILVRDEALALEILEQLQNGEDFATLAATYSIDSSTAPAGGDLGWIAPGDLLLAVVEQVIFSIPASTRYPDPIPSDLGWHVIEVLERDETLSLTDEQLSQQRIQIFQSWLADQRRMATVERFIS